MGEKVDLLMVEQEETWYEYNFSPLFMQSIFKKNLKNLEIQTTWISFQKESY